MEYLVLDWTTLALSSGNTVAQVDHKNLECVIKNMCQRKQLLNLASAHPYISFYFNSLIFLAREYDRLRRNILRVCE